MVVDDTIIVAKIHSLTRILLLIMSISRQMTLTRLLIFVANYSFIISKIALFPNITKNTIDKVRILL